MKNKNFTIQDINTIANFKKFIINYEKMKMLLNSKIKNK